jgi:hypothetical protein
MFDQPDLTDLATSTGAAPTLQRSAGQEQLPLPGCLSWDLELQRPNRVRFVNEWMDLETTVGYETDLERFPPVPGISRVDNADFVGRFPIQICVAQLE